MATTIAAAFAGLRKNLEVTALQKSDLSTRQQNVRSAVEKGFEVLDTFLTGSYPRHTMIAPLNGADIDIFVVLNAKYYSSTGPVNLLSQLRDTIKKTYPQTPAINRDGRAVTITFTDFKVDVVPGFYRTGGGFLILKDTLDAWESTDPKKHEELIAKANTSHNGNLVPLIKMLKGWNKHHNSHFRSFYLELMTERVLRGIRIDNDWSAVRYAFDKGREAVKYTIPDPAGFGEVIKGLVDVDVATAVKWFDWAYAVAYEAERLGNAGSIRAACDEWRKIFGDYFPAYG